MSGGPSRRGDRTWEEGCCDPGVQQMMDMVCLVQQGEFIGCPRYATLVRRGGWRAQYQVLGGNVHSKREGGRRSRAQLQVRMRLLLRVLVTGEQGAPAGDTRGVEGEETGNQAATEKSEAANAPLGGGQSPGESLGNRQNSKWVFEEVKAETRFVSPGGRGEVGEL